VNLKILFNMKLDQALYIEIGLIYLSEKQNIFFIVTKNIYNICKWMRKTVTHIIYTNL